MSKPAEVNNERVVATSPAKRWHKSDLVYLLAQIRAGQFLSLNFIRYSFKGRGP